MIGEYATGRVAVFIDAANILYSQQTMKWSVDYKKLIKYLQKEVHIVCVRFYYGRITENEGQSRFFQILEQLGYTVCTKEVKYIQTKRGTILKGNLDIELAIDMIDLQDTFDTALLMSGDSDFDVVVKRLRAKEKRIIAISSRGHISRELAQNTNKYIPLEKLKNVVRRTSKKNHP